MIKRIFLKYSLQEYFLMFLYRFKRIPRYILAKFFKLKPFHTLHPGEKPYCSSIIRYVNQRSSRKDFLDIGSGLGDIARNVDYERVHCLEYKQEVIDAAVFLHRWFSFNKISFRVTKFNFHEDEVEGRYDVIVLCNWTHNIPSDVFRSKIEGLYFNNLHQNGEIIYDLISKVTDHYPFSHKVDYINENLNAEPYEISVHPITRFSGTDIFRHVISLKKI